MTIAIFDSIGNAEAPTTLTVRIRPDWLPGWYVVETTLDDGGDLPRCLFYRQCRDLERTLALAGEQLALWRNGVRRHSNTYGTTSYRPA